MPGVASAIKSAADPGPRGLISPAPECRFFRGVADDCCVKSENPDSLTPPRLPAEGDPSCDVAAWALGNALHSAGDDLADRVRELFRNAPEKLVRVGYYRVAASEEGAIECPVRFKLTKLLLALFAAMQGR
jgi:hypothetical protein